MIRPTLSTCDRAGSFIKFFGNGSPRAESNVARLVLNDSFEHEEDCLPVVAFRVICGYEPVAEVLEDSDVLHVISTLTNGLRIMSVPQEWQTVVTGSIVIIAVYLDIVRRRRRT
jgi:ABC-type glucose/galactose transport system permease subunit